MQINTVSVETLIDSLRNHPPTMPVAVQCGDFLYAIWNEHIGPVVPLTFYDEYDHSKTVDLLVIEVKTPLGLVS